MSSSVSVYLVPPHEIQQHWSISRAMIQKALSRTPDYDEVSLYRSLVLGERRLWLVYTPQSEVVASVITSIAVYPLSKVCLIFAIGGDDMGEWLHFLPTVVEPWAKAQGCTHMELKGRSGWEKVLGWKKHAVVLRKEL